MPRLGASFRDPSGFVFTSAGRPYRQVNRVFADEFEACTASGLYDALVADKLLVAHAHADLSLAQTPDAHAVLAPELVPFISYPYEWCFGELKDAALLTLDLQLAALERGFVLRDASAYNVQFVDGRPVFIDTLSLARYEEGTPWVAYRQFCQHFLLPLTLMATRDVRCGLMLREHLDGIPLDLGAALLPRRSWFNVATLLHLQLHARSQHRHQETDVAAAIGTRKMPKRSLVSLVQSLRSAITRLEWNPAGTQWAEYVDETNYSDAATTHKEALVRRFVRDARPTTVWDIGANTGVYSRIAREHASSVIAFDVDPAAVERNYRAIRADGETGILPLLVDVTNPSPAIGWAHSERMSFAERGPADLVMALALVHHLAIGNNVPLDRVAAFFAEIGRNLIIEFVAKTDSQVRRLLRNREDVFRDYTKEWFEATFAERFEIVECARVGDADRWLYRMRRYDA